MKAYLSPSLTLLALLESDLIRTSVSLLEGYIDDPLIDASLDDLLS